MQAALGLGGHAKTVIQPQVLPGSGELKSALHCMCVCVCVCVCVYIYICI